MNRILAIVWLLAMLLVAPGMVVSAASATSYPVVETLKQDGLGSVHVQVPGPVAKGLVLLLTGDEGWDPKMKALADEIAELNYVVAGIDSQSLHSYKEAPLTGESTAVTKLLGLSTLLHTKYRITGKHPVIAGYGSGAAIVYSLLAAAPSNLFHAGISLDFCPDQTAGNSGPPLQPVPRLDTTWFVFQSTPPCNADVAARFVREVNNARLDSSIPNSVATTPNAHPWPQLSTLLQWLDPDIVDQLQATDKISGVPLVEISTVPPAAGARMAIMLSGDGGWAELDRTVAAGLAGHGYSVLGWDSLSYFWRSKTPEQASRDLERVLRHYRSAWRPGKITLVGYSFGANVLPFMANRLPPDLKDQIERIVLISPEPSASFEFHLSNWLKSASTNITPLLPEVSRLQWTKVLCAYGDEEESSGCPGFAGTAAIELKLKGDHHFDGDYNNLIAQILQR